MQNRNLGLDMVRSLSIIMVIISHSKFFFLPHVQDRTFLLNLSIVGLYAVEMFFALSGFLIGQILMEEFIPYRDRAHLVRFYLRRWLRTLPAYYLVLTSIVLLNRYFSSDQNWHWSHFVFLQNLYPTEIDFFGVSWTLSIEEWFYLLTPLILLVVIRKTEHAATRLPLFLLASVLLFPLVRWIYVEHYNPSWDIGVRKFFPVRFDALFIGISMAWIRVFFPLLYKKLSGGFTFSLCLTGLISIGIFFANGFPNPKYLDSSQFARVWSFSLISIFLSVSLAFIEQNCFINKTMVNFAPTRIFFTRTSRYAYMIYLLHLDVFILLFPKTTSLFSGAMWLAFGLLCIVPVAIFLHHIFEKPIMDLRDRLPAPYRDL